MDATVALCTRNRAGLLARTLDHLGCLEVPAGLRWELIVVDNGSTDATADVLDRAAALPLRVLREARAGKSHAANLATREARGRLLVWTDDDVRPDPAWLARLVDAARRHPAAAFFGGPVHPWFETEPPPWLRQGLREVSLAFGLLDLGDEERALAPHERANGANLALRTAVARRYPWHPALGPRGDARTSGAESFVQAAAQADGHAGRWVPAARMEHYIATAQMTLGHVRRRYRLHGQALMREERTFAGAARSALSLCLESYPSYVVRRCLRRPAPRWLRDYRRSQTHFGRLQGLFGGAPTDVVSSATA